MNGGEWSSVESGGIKGSLLVFLNRNKLQQNKTETEDKIRDSEDVNENLKCQLTTMTQQLLDTEEELNLSKNELLNCRQEIDVRKESFVLFQPLLTLFFPPLETQPPHL